MNLRKLTGTPQRTTNKHTVMTPYELGFISKCAEYGIDGCAMLKKAESLDLKKLLPGSKFPTEEELKAKEATFSVGDRVKVVDNIRCRQKGKTGTLVGTPKGMDEKTGAGYKLFYVKFDDEKYGTVGFQSGDIDKV